MATEFTSTPQARPTSPAGLPAPRGSVICLCNSNRVWGGGERWHLETALWLARRGYTVILAAGADTPLYQAAQRELAEAGEALGGRLRLADWSFKNRQVFCLRKIKAFANFLRESAVSHLVAGLPIDLKIGALARRRLAGRHLPGLKLFYRRGSALPVRCTLANRFFYGHLHGLIVNSQETARGVLASGRLIAPERVRVIPNGLDVAAFDAAALLPSAAWHGERPLIIGNAGRLNLQKGQKYLLHMSAELARQNFPHRLVIAGGGELEGELRNLARDLGLRVGCGPEDDAEVCFVGFLADMAPFWRDIDLFALSSLWEGFGYVLAEAMLARKPLLAFDCNSMPELVKPGLNGRLAAPPAPGESDAEVGRRLAGLVREMAADPAVMAAMGEAGREFCERNFDQTTAMRRLEEFLGMEPAA